MNFNFVALQNLNLAKANQVQNTLAGSPLSFWMDMNHMAHGGGGPSTCTVHAVGGLNPATIYNPAGTGWDLTIDLARWFFRTYNVGYQVGLFCHEVSAHFMTDDNILQAGGFHRGNTAVVHAPGNSEQGIIGAAGNITDQITTVVNNPGAAAQPDHIFASSNAYARFLEYRNSMHNFGVAMAGAGVAFAAADYRSLVDCWLMDVASIVVTADTRYLGAGPLANAVAAAYNAYRLHLQATFPLPVAGVAVAPPIDAAIHATPVKTAGQVRMDYLRMLAGIIWRYVW
ncbi:hypothetical protein [Desulfoluna spongiiphila]|uniref:hypothetical protein n=1 Tax=Desulfoluna spongiiphila TaxID=419481 RepID=UPI00125116B8|nr:hypothetical protein [Desulfoluna spongiiphila]VVS95570.1 hypothetical protein DBB_51470 [Desulfoluna spongiiphila]